MFTHRRFVSSAHSGGYLNYLEHVPAAQGEKLPLLIYIHGAGSRGSELSQMAKVGPIKELEAGRAIPAVIVAPQCHSETWFDLFDLLTEFIRTCKDRETVDPNRVYITGSSMGAYTTWQMCISHPDWFAAAVPVCGGGMYWDAGRLKDLPIWAFHGALDTVVYPEESLKMVSAVNRSGGNARLTIYPDVEHGAWERAFAEDAMWQWLFAERRSLA